MSKELIKKCENLSQSYEAAYLHIKAFPNFFLTRFGVDFLASFYHAIAAEQDGVGLLIYKDKELIGFLYGTLNSGGFYKRILRKNFITFFRYSLLTLCKSPFLILHIIKVLTVRSKPNNSKKNIASIYSLAVSPLERNMNYGTRLVCSFEDICISKKIEKIVLTTDRDDNVFANNFYNKLGYLVEYEIYVSNRWMNLYCKSV